MNKILIAILIACLAFGEPKNKPQLFTKENCEALVEQLASEFERPFDERYVLQLPKKVPFRALNTRQMPIAAAYDKLSQNIEIALPVMIDHFKDDRFSYVYEDGLSGVFECQTVGGACRQIVGAHVSVSRSIVQKRRADGRIKSFGTAPQKEENYWQKRRDQSLTELQIENLRWALDQDQPEYFLEQEWADAKDELSKLVMKIQETGKPIAIKHRVQFFSK